MKCWSCGLSFSYEVVHSWHSRRVERGFFLARCPDCGADIRVIVKTSPNFFLSKPEE